MIESSKLGDRHLLPIAGLNDDPITKEAFVRIVVPPTWAASRAGQLLTSCLVNQLCRQAKLVRLVEVVAPEATPLILMPDGSSAGAFPALLSNIAIWAVDGTIRVTTTLGALGSAILRMRRRPSCQNRVVRSVHSSPPPLPPARYIRAAAACGVAACSNRMAIRCGLASRPTIGAT
jgi:hypothetical protein